MAPSGKRNGKVDEALSGATEKVLKQIQDLYTEGLEPGSAGSIGLKVRVKTASLSL